MAKDSSIAACRCCHCPYWPHTFQVTTRRLDSRQIRRAHTDRAHLRSLPAFRARRGGMPATRDGRRLRICQISVAYVDTLTIYELTRLGSRRAPGSPPFAGA